MRTPHCLLATALCVPLASAQVQVAPLPADFEMPQPELPPPSSFGAALRDLRFDAAGHPDGAAGELADALRALFEGDVAGATAGFEQLRAAEDTNIAGLATQVMIRLELNRGDYRAAANLLGTPDPYLVGLIAAPAERVEVVETPCATRLVVGATGVPLIAALINGKPFEMWFDTGAAHTTLSRSTAERLGAVIDEDHTFESGTSTSRRVTATFASLEKLEVGNMVFHHHSVFVFDDENLSFVLDDGTPLRVDAILGWNAIRHGRATLDHGRGEYSFAPAAADGEAANLAWLGYPLVRLHADDGRPLLFGLDTGSRNTSIGPSILDKVEFAGQRVEEVSIGGVGGREQLETTIVDELDILLAGHRITMPRARLEPHADAFFVRMDGVLGSDLAPGMVVTVDFPNAHFGLHPSARAR